MKNLRFALLNWDLNQTYQIFSNLLRSIQLCCTELNPSQLMKHAETFLKKKKHKRHNKIINLSLLPPCKSVLRLHSKTANAVPYLWRNASNPTIEFPSLTENGCTTTGDIEWVEEAFPAEVEEQEIKTMARMKMIMVVM